eukprot:349898-Chlamydomonas_euryale.AAC.7
MIVHVERGVRTLHCLVSVVTLHSARSSVKFAYARKHLCYQCGAQRPATQHMALNSQSIYCVWAAYVLAAAAPLWPLYKLVHGIIPGMHDALGILPLRHILDVGHMPVTMV